MQTQRNRRGYIQHFINCKHLWLNELKKLAHDLKNPYLLKENVPEYPRPEFHVSHLKHNTERGALCWIRTDGGFKDPHRGFRDPHKWSLVWWSLAVGPEEIQAAETRLLEKTYPNQTKEQAVKQQSFLWRFATSPAFSEKSRYGSYRFTFPLQDVLSAYSQQVCLHLQRGEFFLPEDTNIIQNSTTLYPQQSEFVSKLHTKNNKHRVTRNNLSAFLCVLSVHHVHYLRCVTGVSLPLKDLLLCPVLLWSSAHHESVQDLPVQKESAVLCVGPQPSQSRALLRVSITSW